MSARSMKCCVDLSELFERERFWDAFCWGCDMMDDLGDCPTGGDAWSMYCPRHRDLEDIEEMLEDTEREILGAMDWLV